MRLKLLLGIATAALLYFALGPVLVDPVERSSLPLNLVAAADRACPWSLFATVTEADLLPTSAWNVECSWGALAVPKRSIHVACHQGVWHGSANNDLSYRCRE